MLSILITKTNVIVMWKQQQLKKNLIQINDNCLIKGIGGQQKKIIKKINQKNSIFWFFCYNFFFVNFFKIASYRIF